MLNKVMGKVCGFVIFVLVACIVYYYFSLPFPAQVKFLNLLVTVVFYSILLFLGLAWSKHMAWLVLGIAVFIYLKMGFIIFPMF
jgi:hypothetical protein